MIFQTAPPRDIISLHCVTMKDQTLELQSFQIEKCFALCYRFSADKYEVRVLPPSDGLERATSDLLE